jgi:hypothetical protein
MTTQKLGPTLAKQQEQKPKALTAQLPANSFFRPFRSTSLGVARYPGKGSSKINSIHFQKVHVETFSKETNKGFGVSFYFFGFLGDGS